MRSVTCAKYVCTVLYCAVGGGSVYIIGEDEEKGRRNPVRGRDDAIAAAAKLAGFPKIRCNEGYGGGLGWIMVVDSCGGEGGRLMTDD